MSFAARPRSNRGLAAVELAVVLPVFLILLLASAELGRALYHYNTLHKAVRDGARYLAEHALNSVPVIEITAATTTGTRNLVLYGNPAGGSTPLLPRLTPGDIAIEVVDAAHVRVTATYAYAPLFGAIPGFGMGPDTSIAGPLVARCMVRAL
jgi:hypothetical protein